MLKKHLRFFVRCIPFLFLASASGAFAEEPEAWKGEPKTTPFSVGVLGGLANINDSAGLATLGTLSRVVAQEGFVPDLNDRVHLEGVVGPFFLPNYTGWQFSARLRWDFQMDTQWGFYGFGGLSTQYIKLKDDAAVTRSTSWNMYPDFGIGALLAIAPAWNLRGEVSHDFILLGAVFDF